MHTLIVMNRANYRENMEDLVSVSARRYAKACYISVNDPYHIVVQTMERANVSADKFIIVDASENVKENQMIGKTTYTIPVTDLFGVYLFLRNLITNEKVEHLLLDSISALIEKHPRLPLKDMLSNLLLEIGALRCSSSIVVFDDHKGHEVTTNLEPFIASTIHI